MGTVHDFHQHDNDVIRCAELRYIRTLLQQLDEVAVRLSDAVDTQVEKYGECDPTLLAAMQVLGYELQNQAFLAAPAAVKLETALLALHAMPEIHEDLEVFHDLYGHELGDVR